MRTRWISLSLIILSGLIAGWWGTTYPLLVHSRPAVQDSPWQPPPTPLPFRPANLLVNGDFEGDYLDFSQSSRLAEGWGAWWLPRTAPGINHEPEFKEEWMWAPSIMVYQGDHAQKYFNNFATHTGGIYQRVIVPEDSVVRFSIWAKVWSSDCGDPCYSPLEPCHPEENDNSNGEYRVAIGIDPTGGADAMADSVEWMPLVEHYGEWFKMEITTTAQAGAVTVFTQGTAKWPVANNFSFWDDARLELISAVTLTPTPQASPTATATTAVPSATPTATAPINTYLPLVGRNYEGVVVTPSPTATSTATVTLTPTPQASPTATATTAVPSATPTATATATISVSPTLTKEPATVTPTATPQITCGEAITNGGFESDTDWSIGDTEYSAAYSTERGHEDSQRSMRLGIELGDPDVETYSYVSQAFHVPENATSAELSFVYYPVSEDTEGDYFDVMLADADGRPVAPILHRHSNLQSWIQPEPFDLSRYAGQDLQLLFNVSNNGTDGVTAVWLDDVTLTICSPGGVSLQSIRRPRILQEPVPGVAVWLTWIRYSTEQIGRSGRCDARCIEWVHLENFGEPVDMAGWTLEDEAGNTFTFPSLRIPHGHGIRVWIRDGEPVRGRGVSDLYWGSPEELLEDAGDKLILRDPDGASMSEMCYSVPDQRDPGPCP